MQCGSLGIPDGTFLLVKSDMKISFLIANDEALVMR